MTMLRSAGSMPSFCLLLGLVAAFISWPAGTAFAAAPKLHALVIGINDYPALPESKQLKGAVNDAVLVREALKEAGAVDLVTLLNGEATLKAIRANLKQLSAEAKSGDWIYVHFAGHGVQLPALDPSTEQEAGEKLDEVFATTEFDTSGKLGVLRDDEIHQWLKSVPRDVKVMFIADACHSGTGARRLNRFDLRFVPRSRSIEIESVSGAAVPSKSGAPPVIRKIQDVQLPNVVFVPATIDEKEVLEVISDGQIHGALSVVMARALKGYADSAGNRDGGTTLVEFDRFLRSETSRLSAEGAEKQQTSNAKFSPGREAEVVPFFGKPGAVNLLPAKTQMVRLLVEGSKSRFDRLPPGITLVQRFEDADVVWNASKGEVALAKGDSQLLAEGVRANSASASALPEALLGAIGKRRALTTLSDIVSRRPLPIKVCVAAAGRDDCRNWTSDNPLLIGQVVTVNVGAQRGGTKHFFAFNLASTGILQLQQSFTGENTSSIVQPPFGRDDVVVVGSSESLDVIKKRLVGLACGDIIRSPCDSAGPVAEKVVAELADFMNKAGTQADIRVGHAFVYTRDRK